MSPSETPSNPSHPSPQDSNPAPTALAEMEPAPDTRSEEKLSAPPVPVRSSSRYVDYDTHELLDKISQYEDERRWQRIREGIWISLLAHFLFFSALTWIPRYIFHAPVLIDPTDAIRQRKDLTYLDELPDALKQIQKVKPKLPPIKPNEAIVDKKTLEALKQAEKARPKPAPPAPAPQQAQTPPAPQPPTPAPQPQQQAVAPPPTPAPQQPQLALENPRPAPVPARPNFSLNQANPADQLRQAVRDSAKGDITPDLKNGPRSKDPNGASGARILSDTMGVDFNPYLRKLQLEIERTWEPLIPDEVNPPINKRGQVEIVFTILPNGRLQPTSMKLVGRSGDVALDRAAWGSIAGSDFPPLPQEFHGPNLQIAVLFSY